jgi:hypothetical protein
VAIAAPPAWHNAAPPGDEDSRPAIPPRSARVRGALSAPSRNTWPFGTRPRWARSGGTRRSTMGDTAEPTDDARRQPPWNRGRLLGQKPPLKRREVWALRICLQIAERLRDLALFNLAIDSKLRGCDLVSYEIRLISTKAALAPGRRRPGTLSRSAGSGIIQLGTVKQKATNRAAGPRHKRRAGDCSPAEVREGRWKGICVIGAATVTEPPNVRRVIHCGGVRCGTRAAASLPAPRQGWDDLSMSGRRCRRRSGDGRHSEMWALRHAIDYAIKSHGLGCKSGFP